MKTAFHTGPGFYAAASIKTDKSVPPGFMRLFCARLEAYDLPIKGDEIADQTTFEIIFAKAEKDPRLANALLQLAKAVDMNREMLEGLAGKP